jgi:hypothetical protein
VLLAIHLAQRTFPLFYSAFVQGSRLPCTNLARLLVDRPRFVQGMGHLAQIHYENSRKTLVAGKNPLGAYNQFPVRGTAAGLLKKSFNMQGLLKKFLSNNKLGE